VLAVLRRSGLLLAVAAATFALAYDNGAFSLSTRSSLAIAVWWTIVLALALGAWPVARVPRAAIAAAALLAGFAAWTAVSASWAANGELAFLEFDRVTLYLGVFLVAVLAGSRGTLARWIDGLALGLVAVAAVALSSRLFPSLFPDETLPTFLPSARTRLSFPVQYWNGLGILTALALPLLLRAGVAGRTALGRGAALAAMPIVGATIYLTSSRGGAATALAGALAALALSRRRWRMLAALGCAAVGFAGAVALLVTKDAIVRGSGSEQAAQGRLAAVFLVLLCLGTGALWAAASSVRVAAPPRRVGRALVAAGAALLVAAVLLAHPARRFESFKRPPTQVRYSSADFTRAHLLSGNGSGRWQFWAAAGDEWRSAPLAGRGAGSFESWWARHGSISYFVRDAHSLYAETAGELGLVGLALLLGFFGLGVATAAPRARRADDDGAAAIAALGGALGGYLVGVGLDWMWELTIVSLVGMTVLGLLVGPATEPLRRVRDAPRARFGLGVALAAAGWLVLCAQAAPLLVDSELRASQRASARGDVASAIARARTARKLEPWASSPYLQLALVAEQAGNLRAAREWIGAATRRDREGWRPWLVEARIATEQGDIAGARRALHRAAALNPRSPLFAAVRPGR
jgi:tetratricopeptide (TPR) repeat protein